MSLRDTGVYEVALEQHVLLYRQSKPNFPGFGPVPSPPPLLPLREALYGRTCDLWERSASSGMTRGELHHPRMPFCRSTPACSATTLEQANLRSFPLQKCNPIIRNLWLAVRVLLIGEMKNVVLRSIAYHYPGFQSLPRGIKKMLLFSESFFFSNEKCRSCADLLRPLGRSFRVAPLVRAPVSVAAAWRN